MTPIPATTPAQYRQRYWQGWHQCLWDAYEQGLTMMQPVTPETAHHDQLQAIDKTKNFWKSRGYRVRTQVNADRTVLTVWLEPKGRAV